MPTPIQPPEAPPPAHPPIPAGPATWLGALLAILTTVIIPGIGALADSGTPLHVPATWWVTIGAVLALVVILGRMLQAAVAIWRPPTPPPPESDGAQPPSLRLVQ